MKVKAEVVHQHAVPHTLYGFCGEQAAGYSKAEGEGCAGTISQNELVVLHNEVGHNFCALHPFLKAGIYTGFLAAKQTEFAEHDGGGADCAYEATALHYGAYCLEHTLVASQIGGTGQATRHNECLALSEVHLVELNIGDEARAMATREVWIASDIDKLHLCTRMAEYVEGTAGFAFLETLRKKDIDHILFVAFAKLHDMGGSQCCSLSTQTALAQTDRLEACCQSSFYLSRREVAFGTNEHLRGQGGGAYVE